MAAVSPVAFSTLVPSAMALITLMNSIVPATFWKGECEIICKNREAFYDAENDACYCLLNHPKCGFENAKCSCAALGSSVIWDPKQYDNTAVILDRFPCLKNSRMFALQGNQQKSMTFDKEGNPIYMEVKNRKLCKRNKHFVLCSKSSSSMGLPSTSVEIPSSSMEIEATTTSIEICAPYYTHVERDGKDRCFSPTGYEQTFQQANDSCIIYEKGFLVVPSVEETDPLNNWLENLPLREREYYWVNVQMAGDVAQYYINDTTILTDDSTLWGPDQPSNERCVAYYPHTGKLYALQCHTNLGSICEKSPLNEQ